MNPTPGQTVGPFFHLGLPVDRGHELVPPGSPGAVRLHGRVLDGAGQAVPDAVVELWQPDPEGRVVQQPGSLRRDGWTFTGWGRAATDPDGHYSFTTLEPGPAVAGRPAYFALTVFARGLLDRLFTRAYLPGPETTGPETAGRETTGPETAGRETTGPETAGGDPVLSALPPDRRATLVCAREPHGLRFDIRLQGDGETVFLSYPGQRQSWA